MTERRPGPDHPLYSHWPRPGRAALRWPGGARTALLVFVYFEAWDLAAPSDAVRDRRLDGPLGGVAPNLRPYTQFEFGNRVGMFRILPLLDRLGLRATVPANALAVRKYPFLVEEFRRRGSEFAGHGSAANVMMSSRMSEANQRTHIADSIVAVRHATGAPPAGWVSQDYGESTITPRLLAEAGLSWVADWGNDDQPYAMSTEPALVSVPNQAEWDDVQLMHHRGVSPTVWRDSAIAAFDVLHAEGGACFGVHIHPWLVGMPHRIGHLEAVLAHVAGADGVWRATAGEVKKAVLCRVEDAP